MRHFVPAIAIAVILPWCMPATFGADDPIPTSSPAIFSQNREGRWADVASKLAALPDAELESLLLSTQQGNGASDKHFDFCLSEIVRRGGQRWQTWVEAHLRLGRSMMNSDDRAVSMQMLTVLRRLQKKDDPVVILKRGKAEARTTIGYFPMFELSLVNLDSEKRIVGFETGGDYRGASKPNKWRLEIRDEAGNLLPTKKEYDMGGIVRFETLNHAESLAAELSPAMYVAIETTGNYTVTAYYHPEIRIGTESSIEGLICCRSIPIKMTVEPVKVQTTPEAQARAAQLVLQLPATGAVRVLGGAYPEEGIGDFMPKESVAGQLHRMEWEALPALVKAINGDTLNETQKAWAFGLLYGITGLHNPLEMKGIMPGYEYQHSGWSSLGGPANGMASFFRGSSSMTGGRIDPKAQQELARKWLPFVEKYMEIEMTPLPSATLPSLDH